MKRKYGKVYIVLLISLCLLLASCGKKEPSDSSIPTVGTTTAPEQVGTQETEATDLRMPWEVADAKQPGEYTLAEYEALTPEQRKAFRDYLGADGYTAWLEWAEEEEAVANEVCPWDTAGAKQPKDYMWAEYQALTERQKKAFMENLGPYGLEAWLRKVQNQNQETYPWDIAGAKQPKDYTWAEYQTLTYKQQAAFVKHLGAVGYQVWLTKVQGQKEVFPWEIAGAKKPQQYSWEDYGALTVYQKKAFRDYLGTQGFVAWLESAQEKDNPWEKPGAKQPAEYTWEEYQVLTEVQKLAFQECLGAQGFTEWQNAALMLENPWEKPGAKQPKDYTWAEFEALAEVQQAAFRDYLGEGSMIDWIRRITDIPWEKKGAKQPGDYTLKEYEDLKDPQQLVFRIFMGPENFEEWMLEAQKPKEENPWEKPGTKQPENYTWEEFNRLTVDQQMAFQDYLGEKGFQDWLDKVQGELSKNPWEEIGAKQPQDYTWAEFAALTADHQMAFQQYLGADAFEAWLNRVQNQPKKNPWEKPGAKQPKDYTRAEFEALTAEQQMAFQNYLGPDAFEAWLNRVQNQTEKNPWEYPGAKQPRNYTWAEFEALTAEQQMAFQNYLGPDAFEAWLSRVQNQTEKNPWEYSGAKQPKNYTWAEFEALTGPQQIAFQNYLGSDAFEAWMNRVLGS